MHFRVAARKRKRNGVALHGAHHVAAASVGGYQMSVLPGLFQLRAEINGRRYARQRFNIAIGKQVVQARCAAVETLVARKQHANSSGSAFVDCLRDVA